MEKDNNNTQMLPEEELAYELKKTRYSNEYFYGENIKCFKKNLKKFHLIRATKSLFNALKSHNDIVNMYKRMNEGEINNSIDFSTKKIVIYTCVTGKYDNIKEPFIKAKNIDYIMFTDNTNITSKSWIIKKIPDKYLKELKGNFVNRYIKLHPSEFFSDYDYAIYIDGNVKVISNPIKMLNCLNLNFGVALHKHCLRTCVYDEANVCIKAKKGNKKGIKEQISKYKKDGFPGNYGLLEATVIISEINNPNASTIFNDWWQEYINTGSFRDQLSLPYTLWKKNIQIDAIGTLGNCVYTNKHFYILSH